MMKIILLFTFIVANLLAKDKLESLVDVEIVKKKLECNPVLQTEFVDYMLKADYNYYSKLSDDYKKKYFINSSRNNQVIFFCKKNAKEDEDSFYLVFYNSDKHQIDNTLTLYEIGKLIKDKTTFKLKEFTNKFDKAEGEKNIVSNFYMEAFLSGMAYYFVEYKDEWFYLIVD